MAGLAKRTDNNQREIVEALRQAGATVYCAHSVGHGFPDLVIAFREKIILAEVKSKRGKLTRAERLWHAAWPVPVPILRSIDDALKLLEDIE